MARMHRARKAARTTRQLIEGLESRTLFSVSVGANIENVADFTPTQMFVDAMKSARGFGSASAPCGTSGASPLTPTALANPGRRSALFHHPHQPVQQLAATA